MQARKTATSASTAGRSRVTAALRKATNVVAKAAGRGSSSATGEAAKKTSPKKAAAKKATKATAKKAPAKTTAAAKKTTAKKTSAAKTPAQKTSAAKAPAKKTSVAKAPAKKTSPAKATAKTTTAKKTTTTKAVAVKKASAKKAATTVKKAAAKKTVTKKTTATKAATEKAAAAKTPAKKAAAGKKATPTKKAAVKKVTPTKQTAPANARKLKVRDDESPWTATELAAVRAELQADVERLTHELSGFEDDIAGLIKDSGDGAGDDQADTGAKTFEREHEASLAQNSRDLLEQSVHALQRIDDGTYGICENCGNAIGKLRLQAFPRATLCLTCKAQQERR